MHLLLCSWAQSRLWTSIQVNCFDDQEKGCCRFSSVVPVKDLLKERIFPVSPRSEVLLFIARASRADHPTSRRWL